MFDPTLFEAIKQGKTLKEFQDLIQAGHTFQVLDLHGFTILMEASNYGRLDLVQLLLNLGVDPKLQTDEYTNTNAIKMARWCPNPNTNAIIRLLEGTDLKSKEVGPGRYQHLPEEYDMDDEEHSFRPTDDK